MILMLAALVIFALGWLVYDARKKEAGGRWPGLPFLVKAKQSLSIIRY